MRRRNNDKTIKVCANFTPKQIELIEKVNGVLGSNRSAIVHQIVILYLQSHKE
jgi:hypothetical protein